MTYYKAFDRSLCCRGGLQYAIGETTSVDGEIEMHKNGIHCCKQALHCLNYYQGNSRFCEVIPEGDIGTKDDETVSRAITVVREIVDDELSILLTGTCRYWYTSGQPKAEYTYVDGQANGPCRRWYENGQLSEKYSYVNGKRDGPYESWYEDGRECIKCTYSNGRCGR